jgi:methylated-DNA-protein-cysteine methyltransferase-like protein
MPYDPDRHGPRRIVGPGFREQVYAVVKTVPRGRVTTYGDVAARLGLRRVARHVGFALAALDPGQDDVPWHRVVNAKGRISARNTDAAPCNQRCRLTEDGVVVTDDGRVESFPGIRHVF